jgi:hypothetical protein
MIPDKRPPGLDDVPRVTLSAEEFIFFPLIRFALFDINREFVIARSRNVGQK